MGNEGRRSEQTRYGAWRVSAIKEEASASYVLWLSCNEDSME